MRRQNNIGDRIPGPYLMKGNVFNFLTMDRCFNLCDQPEYLQCIDPGHLIQVGVLQTPPDITVMSMLVLMVTFLFNSLYRKPSAGKRTVIMIKRFQFNKVRKPSIVDHLSKALLKLRKSIQHTADEHVTR